MTWPSLAEIGWTASLKPKKTKVSPAKPSQPRKAKHICFLPDKDADEVGEAYIGEPEEERRRVHAERVGAMREDVDRGTR